MIGFHTITITPMFCTDDFERNYNRHCGNVEYCVCCGRKLNPKTMKRIQAIEPGEFVEPGCGDIPEIHTDEINQTPMGWYPVGPICYKEIRRRLFLSNETRQIMM